MDTNVKLVTLNEEFMTYFIIRWYQNFLIHPILNADTFILLMNFVNICTKWARNIGMKLIFTYIEI
jgi:hypothetical protein